MQDKCLRLIRYPIIQALRKEFVFRPIPNTDFWMNPIINIAQGSRYPQLIEIPGRSSEEFNVNNLKDLNSFKVILGNQQA
ncbi:hypothetical protein TNIN_35511 [Trichonephila inaurata madagascariensis]|uniref:Uncharacterized protein n=1 Tax=Trichonephila inaurata madagascariensis TaxID=2747483 RepID=A0A8X6Y103_9ARAC|nr:hypothetical protein TNIN_35511 [Trichonephila inaurata madagascariensis]